MDASPCFADFAIRSAFFAVKVFNRKERKGELQRAEIRPLTVRVSRPCSIIRPYEIEQTCRLCHPDAEASRSRAPTLSRRSQKRPSQTRTERSWRVVPRRRTCLSAFFY